MIRLLLLLACVGLTLMALLQVRQQQQAIRAQNLGLHRQIRTLERTLWRQQVMVGADLAPGSLENQVDVPTPAKAAELPVTAGGASWGAVFE